VVGHRELWTVVVGYRTAVGRSNDQSYNLERIEHWSPRPLSSRSASLRIHHVYQNSNLEPPECEAAVHKCAALRKGQIAAAYPLILLYAIYTSSTWVHVQVG
jgi:hypothetical protein